MNHPPRGLSLLVLLLLLASGQALGQDDAGQDTRTVEVDVLGFEVTVPTVCKIELNERLRGSSFLKVQFTTAEGRPMPGNISFIYTPAPPDAPLKQLDSAKDYRNAWLNEMKPIYADVEAVDIRAVEVSGLRGFAIEYTHSVGEIPVRARQYNLVQPDGSGRFIFTYGTVAQLWENDAARLEAILDTVSIKPPGDPAPQN